VVQRALNEARAARLACDVVETNGPEMEALSREGVLDEFRSPHFADLPPAAFPPHRRYVADRFNFFTIAYNTRLVSAEEVPNGYDDLLHPRFTGRLGLEAGDVDWFGAMVKHMGEEQGLAYFRRLAAAKPQIRSGHTLIGQLVASGEIPIAANVYNHNAERVAVQGAPIRWKALTPTFGRPNAIGVARRAPHPHAALLFADFLLSREGQMILKERHRVPSSRAVDSHLNAFPFEMIDPAITLDEHEKWSTLWSDLFLRGERVPRDQG
jgi:iron(III) transport system substrate-binding protein